jgi:hypothetical protein
VSSAAAIPATTAERARVASLPCPNANAFRTSCKKRTCPVCGPRWARDWRKVMFVNLDAYDGPVVMVSITAPGDERLPWDEHHCAGRHTRGGNHSGKRGCRVEQRAAREWNETATTRYAMLRRTATQHLRRMVSRGALAENVNLLERVWEPQKRGVAHLHLVLGAGTREEIEAAAEFVKKLKDEAESYDFGFVDARGRFRKGMAGERVVARGEIVKLISAENAARYLSSYLSGRSGSKHKGSIRESLTDPAIEALQDRGVRIAYPCKPCEGHGKVNDPKGAEVDCYWCKGSGVTTRKPLKQSLPLVWLTPRLTRVTGLTMRTLRRARHLWAAARGICEEFPKWRDIYEAIEAGVACRRAFPQRGEGDAGPPLEVVLAQALRLADKVTAQVSMLPDRGPNVWVRYKAEEELLEFATDVACDIAGIERIPLEERLAVAA